VPRRQRRRPVASGTRARLRRTALTLRRATGASVLLHLAFLALLVVANLQWRDKRNPPEEAPAYEVAFEGKVPDRPGNPDADALPTPPRPGEPSPPPPLAPPVSPPPVAPVQPTPQPPSQALLAPPPVPPLPPAEPEVAELPPPPPPQPPRPQPPQQQALVQPPRPPQPRPPRPQQQAQPLPPLQYLPGPLSFGPPPRPGGAPRGPGQLDPGRGPDTDFQTSRNLGDDWRSLFRRWVDDHKHYPRDAVLLGHQGPVTVRMVVALDGSVKSVTMVAPSYSPWLNSNLVHLFQGAKLPALPAGANPAGETIIFTMRYILY
jgi:TonB family protein